MSSALIKTKTKKSELWVFFQLIVIHWKCWNLCAEQDWAIHLLPTQTPTLWDWPCAPAPQGTKTVSVHIWVRCLFWCIPVCDLLLASSRQLPAQPDRVLSCCTKVWRLPAQSAEASKCSALHHYQETLAGACIPLLTMEGIWAHT